MMRYIPDEAERAYFMRVAELVPDTYHNRFVGLGCMVARQILMRLWKQRSRRSMRLGCMLRMSNLLIRPPAGIPNLLCMVGARGLNLIRFEFGSR